MSKLYRSREGAVTAVNTKTQLSTLGSETAPGSFLVPVQAKRLVKIIAAASSDLATAHEGAHFVRIEGNGLEREKVAVRVKERFLRRVGVESAEARDLVG